MGHPHCSGREKGGGFYLADEAIHAPGVETREWMKLAEYGSWRVPGKEQEALMGQTDEVKISKKHFQAGYSWNDDAAFRVKSAGIHS